MLSNPDAERRIEGADVERRAHLLRKHAVEKEPLEDHPADAAVALADEDHRRRDERRMRLEEFEGREREVGGVVGDDS